MQTFSPLLLFFFLDVAACGGAARESPPAAEPLVVALPARDGGAGVAVEDAPRPATSGVPVASNGPRERFEETARRHRSSILDGQPRPARLAPGTYGCRSGAIYKFRPCEVTKDAQGFTHILMPGSLIAFSGVVYDDGAALILDGTNADVRPFGCFNCDERCSDTPGSCFCTELAADGSRECLAQPLTVRMTKVGANWRGSLSMLMYSNRYEGVGAQQRVVAFEKRTDSFVIEIAPATSITKK